MKEKENLHAGHRSRMMKKVLNNADVLAEHELLETLLFYALPRIDTNGLAHEIINTFGGINGVLKANADELKAINGVGDSVAGIILIVSQLVKRFGGQKEKKISLSTPQKLQARIQELFTDLTYEKFLFIMLDAKYNIIAQTGFTSADPNVVKAEIPSLSKALSLHKPTHAVIAHSHTGNTAEASKADDDATRRINLLCEIHGCNLIDHVILARGNALYSYHMSGRLDEIKKQSDVDRLFDKIKESYND